MNSDFRRSLEDIMEEAYIISNYSKSFNVIEEDAISQIPVIKYPGINADECITIHKLAQKVLEISKNENDNKEVVITYSLEHEKLRKNNKSYMTIVKGNEESTEVMSDTDTYSLMMNSDNLVIINLHNHPNTNGFSMDDVMFFIKNEQIKLMTLLSHKGDVHYLLKNDTYKRYENIVAFANYVKEVIPEAFIDGKIHMQNLDYSAMTKIAEKYIENTRSLGVNYQYVPHLKPLMKENIIGREQKR